jgi:transposase
LDFQAFFFLHYKEDITMKKKRLPKNLEKINFNAAGIDIGSTEHYVAVPEDRADKNVRCFQTFTSDLYDLANWLKECKVTTIAMESTGVYWIPLFQILEEKGFEVFLVNAHHVKNVPGRKTDVKDCQWLQELHTFGLLRASFQPEPLVRQLRAYIMS